MSSFEIPKSTTNKRKRNQLTSSYSAYLPPSSPRIDEIRSITSRIQYNTKIKKLIHNISSANKKLKLSSSNLPRYQNTRYSETLDKPKTIEALKQVDYHLRRRCIYKSLSENMIIKGTIYNKTHDHIIIELTHVYLNENEKKNMIPRPTLSSLSRSSATDNSIFYNPFYNIYELQIRGIYYFSSLEHNFTYDDIQIGLEVKAAVLSVNMYSEHIYLTFKQPTSSSSLHAQNNPNNHHLGIIPSSTPLLSAIHPSKPIDHSPNIRPLLSESPKLKPMGFHIIESPSPLLLTNKLSYTPSPINLKQQKQQLKSTISSFNLYKKFKCYFTITIYFTNRYFN